MAWKSENGERPEESGVNYFSTLINGDTTSILQSEKQLSVPENHWKKTAGRLAWYGIRREVEKACPWCFIRATVVVLTDRNDLDNQLFGTFCASSKLLLRQTPKQAQNRENLKDLLRVNAGGIIFTTIQKFEESGEVLSERNNIIFMSDEAHRSQYGLDGKLDRKTGEWMYGMAKYMRDSLPNATFIGFTGTPIDFDDKSAVEVFGDYIDIYDMTQAVEDGATVPIYYENRTAKLKLNAELFV